MHGQVTVACHKQCYLGKVATCCHTTVVVLRASHFRLQNMLAPCVLFLLMLVSSSSPTYGHPEAAGDYLADHWISYVPTHGIYIPPIDFSPNWGREPSLALSGCKSANEYCASTRRICSLCSKRSLPRLPEMQPILRQLRAIGVADPGSLLRQACRELCNERREKCKERKAECRSSAERNARYLY